MWGLWKPAHLVGGGGSSSKGATTHLLGFVARLAWVALFVWLVLRKLGMSFDAVLLKYGLAVRWCCVGVGPDRTALSVARQALYTSTCTLHTNENTNKHHGFLLLGRRAFHTSKPVTPNNNDNYNRPDGRRSQPVAFLRVARDHRLH